MRRDARVSSGEGGNRARRGALFDAALAGLQRLTSCCSEGSEAVLTSLTTPLRGDWFRLAPEPAADAKGNPASSFLSARGSKPGSFEIDDDRLLHSLIDEVPLLAGWATFTGGPCCIRRGEELVFKETNRLVTSRDMLRAFGAEAEVLGATLTIRGQQPLQAASVPGFGDHRIAMTAAVLASTCRGTSRIVDGDCHATSFPEFVGAMRALGVDIGAARS